MEGTDEMEEKSAEASDADEAEAASSDFDRVETFPAEVALLKRADPMTCAARARASCRCVSSPPPVDWRPLRVLPGGWCCCLVQDGICGGGIWQEHEWCG